MASYLLVIGERKGLAWVVEHRRMAFPVLRGRDAANLRRGDELLLYTTRGCFHGPHQDRGRVIGLATVSGDIHAFEEPEVIAHVACGSWCHLRIQTLAPFRTGLVLAPLVRQLAVFPDPQSWGAKMRTTLLRLPDKDAALLRKQLEPLVVPASTAEAGYLEGAYGPRERSRPAASPPSAAGARSP